MSRPRKRPDYDPMKILNELLDAVVASYQNPSVFTGEKNEIRTIAEELDISPNKVRKLLITAGIRDGVKYYENASCQKVADLNRKGMTVNQIMEATGLTRTSVCCYLPYSKGLYNAKEISLDAERVRRYREKKEHCEGFLERIADMKQNEAATHLWETMQYLQGCYFNVFDLDTRSIEKIKYSANEKELVVSKKNIHISREDVVKSFVQVMEMSEEVGACTGARSLGFEGAPYIYPIFQRLGLCRRDKGNDGTI